MLHLKLWRRFSFLYFVGLFLIVLGQTTFAQDSNNPAAPQTDTAASENHNTKDLEKLINDYNKDAQKVIQDTQKLQEGEMPSTDVNEADVAELENIQKKNQGKKAKKEIKDSKKIKYGEVVQMALAPLQSMSEEQLVISLKENTRGTMAHQYVMDYPRFALFVVRLIKDKDALPSIARILEDKDKLVKFLAVMVSTILIGFILKRLLSNPKRTIAQSFLMWMARLAIMTAFRIFIVYLFYEIELTPFFKVFGKTFL